ncbi:MAG: hypothetical protein IKC75_03190 [Clostridia bacterium]|nr:hypothetical protein [Clostridia bacterium]
MGQTVLGLFGVCLAAALAELLLPGEEGKGTRGILRLLVALAVLLLISRPVLTHFHKNEAFALEALLGESEDKTAEYQAIFEQALQGGGARELHAALLKLLEKEYGIKEGDAEVKIYFEASGEPRRVEIYLSGAALLNDPDEIAAYVSERLHCETEVR